MRKKKISRLILERKNPEKEEALKPQQAQQEF
jgi:hypothetical protein